MTNSNWPEVEVRNLSPLHLWPPSLPDSLSEGELDPVGVDLLLAPGATAAPDGGRVELAPLRRNIQHYFPPLARLKMESAIKFRFVKKYIFYKIYKI